MLRRHEADLRARGVDAITVFGLIARHQATTSSDMDQAFRPAADFSSGGFDHFDKLEALREHLTELLGVRRGPRRRASGSAPLQANYRHGRRPSLLAARLSASGDILDNIRLIQSYLEGMDRSEFEADSRTRDAVERCLERITKQPTGNWVRTPAACTGAAVAGRPVVRECTPGTAYDQIDKNPHTGRSCVGTCRCSHPRLASRCRGLEREAGREGDEGQVSG